MRAVTLAILAALSLTACSGNKSLHGSRPLNSAPDEFAVLPSRMLAMPETLALPAPTPGGANRADQTPEADGIAALGGNAAGGVGGDAALMAHVGRYGIDPAIRATTAAEDEAFRRRRAMIPFGGIFNRDRYFQAYSGLALDAYAELARFRALGVEVPSAPPAN